MNSCRAGVRAEFDSGSLEHLLEMLSLPAAFLDRHLAGKGQVALDAGLGSRRWMNTDPTDSKSHHERQPLHMLRTGPLRPCIALNCGR